MDQSVLRWWTISSASCELSLLPKPLSVRARNSALPKETMPEKPCTDWPLIGKVPPDLRGYLASPTKVTPSMLFSTSVRWRLAALNLPAVSKKGPAALGASTVVKVDKAAWPANTAVTSVCADALMAVAAMASAAARRVGEKAIMVVKTPC